MATKPATKTGTKPPAKPAPAPASKALAVKGGALDVFKEQEAALVPLVELGMSSDYVQFAHTNAKNYSEIVALFKKIPNGTPLLVQGREITRLNPFMFIAPPMYIQYYAECDADGKPMSAQSTEGRRPQGWDEFVESVILVVINEGKTYSVIPARCRFRGPKTPAYKAADKARIEASLPEWIGRSPNHKAASQSGLPAWAWNLHTVDITVKEPRKKTNEKGEPTSSYELASSSCEPAPIMLLRTLINLQKSDEAFAESLQKCIDGFNATKDEIEKLY